MRTFRSLSVPDDPAALPGFLRQLVRSIGEAAIRAEPFIVLEELHAAPERLLDGMVARADGTDWDPGAGQGIYGYYGGAWVKL